MECHAKNERTAFVKVHEPGLVGCPEDQHVSAISTADPRLGYLPLLAGAECLRTVHLASAVKPTPCSRCSDPETDVPSEPDRSVRGSSPQRGYSRRFSYFFRL